MNPNSYKICPRCQTPAELNSPQCAQCGRQYRTQFADQTQVFTAPAPAMAMGYAPAVAPQVQSAVLDECAHHYHQITWYRIIAFLFVPVGFIGLVVLFCLHQTELKLRARVADLGINAHDWERQQLPRRNRIYWRFWATFLGIIFALGVLSIISTTIQHNRDRAEEESRHQLDFEQTPTLDRDPQFRRVSPSERMPAMPSGL